MRVAIVGSRDYPTDDLVRVAELVLGLPGGTVVVTGDASGVDTIAWVVASAHKMEAVRYLADWERLGNAAGGVRTRRVVNDADEVHAFLWPGSPTGSPGTKLAIKEAERIGIPYSVWRPGKERVQYTGSLFRLGKP